MAPHLALLPEDAGRREHPLRGVLDGPRHVVRAGAPGGRHARARREGVKPPGAERGFALPPRRQVVEQSSAWSARRRRLVRGHERPPDTVAGRHFVAFACLTLRDVALAHGP